MKLISTILFLTISIVAFGQKNMLFNTMYNNPTNNIGSGNDITFNNPMAGRTWKTDSTSTGMITVPLGYTGVSWSILKHPEYLENGTAKTEYTKTTGSTLEVTYEFDSTFILYDLRVTATKPGAPNKNAIFIGEFMVVPEYCPEAKADVVYDFATTGIGSKVGNNTNRVPAAYNPGTSYSTGNKVAYGGNYWRALRSTVGDQPDISALDWEQWYAYYIIYKGDYDGTGQINPYDWVSSDSQFPVVFQFNNCTVNSTNKIFAPGQCINTMFLGNWQQGTKYGLKLEKDAAATVDLEGVVFNCFDGPTHTRSRNVYISGIDIDNLNSSVGGTGLQVTTKNTTDDHYGTVWMNYLYISDIRVRNTRNEGYYLYHFNDSPASGRSFSPGYNNFFFRLISEDTGNEGLQMSSCINCEIFNCSFTNAGTRDQSQHRNQFQFGGGNRNLFFYMNYSNGSKNVFGGSTGLYGTDVEVFSNVMYSTGKNASDGVNFQVTLEENDSTASIDWLWRNNTIILTGTGFTQVPFSIYNQASTTVFNKHRFDGNAIYSNTITFAEYPNGYTPGAAQSSNNQQSTNINSFGFVNTSTDFHPSSTSSALFRSRTPMTGRHRYIEFDFDGKKMLSSHPVDGAYFGSLLFDGN